MSLLSQWANGDFWSAIRDKTNTAIGTIGQSLVSNTDTSFGYLFDKLVAGTNITLTKQNTGSNETILIDVTGISTKLNASSILVQSTSAIGPTNYLAETTMRTLTPSASLSSAKMRYTFTGYLSNNVVDTATIRIKKNGTQIAITKTTVPDGQINFCLEWITNYTAGDIITATVQGVADTGDCNSYTLLCQSLDAI